MGEIEQTDMHLRQMALMEATRLLGHSTDTCTYVQVLRAAEAYYNFLKGQQ